MQKGSWRMIYIISIGIFMLSTYYLAAHENHEENVMALYVIMIALVGIAAVGITWAM